MSNPRRDKLVGTLLSLPTFNDENFNLLLDRHKIHINWLIENGITEGNGVLLIAGGLGEGAFLSNDQWRVLAELVVEAADGRTPTAIGIGELSAREVVDKGQIRGGRGRGFYPAGPATLHGAGGRPTWRTWTASNGVHFRSTTGPA